MTLNASIVAAGEHLDDISDRLSERFGQSFRLHPLAASQPVDPADLSEADAIVLEVAPGVPQSLARIAQVREALPQVLLIAAIADMDVGSVRALIRQGVDDVVALPFDPDELFATIMDLGSAKVVARDDLAPLIGIVHASGGAGASTVASHFPVAVTKANPNWRCCVIDLDLQNGELSLLLGQEPVTNVYDLLEAKHRLDEDVLVNAAVPCGENVFLLAAPDHIAPTGDIDPDTVLGLLQLARTHYDCVVLDLPADWTNWSLSAACACDELFLIVEQSMRSLRRASRTIALLGSVDIPQARMHLIVNRFEKRMFGGIDLAQVERTLGVPTAVAVPFQKSGLSEAQDNGILLGTSDPRSRFVRAIDELAVLAMTGRG